MTLITSAPMFKPFHMAVPKLRRVGKYFSSTYPGENWSICDILQLSVLFSLLFNLVIRHLEYKLVMCIFIVAYLTPENYDALDADDESG